MTSKSTPLSIRIIYYLTQFVFWATLLGALLAVFFLGAGTLGLFKETTDTSLDIPLRLELEETGTMTAYGKTYQVEIQDAVGTFKFSGLPRRVTTVVMFGALGFLALIISVIWFFRKFIINVKQGLYFTERNIGYLKKMSYCLLGLWIYILIISNISAGFFMTTLEFDTVQFKGSKSESGPLLFGALFIWVLSHIFSKGVKLQQEQDLTI